MVSLGTGDVCGICSSGTFRCSVTVATLAKVFGGLVVAVLPLAVLATGTVPRDGQLLGTATVRVFALREGHTGVQVVCADLFGTAHQLRNGAVGVSGGVARVTALEVGLFVAAISFAELADVSLLALSDAFRLQLRGASADNDSI